MNKYFYYVQVTQTYKGEDGKFYNKKRYVTSINNPSRVALWTAGEKPRAFSRSLALSICEGLCMNMHNAQVVTAFWELDENQNL